MWEDRSLPALFGEAVSLYEEVERKYEQELYIRCVAIWEECERRVAALALFSSNETFEDLQTSSVRFLAVEYYLGKVLALHRSHDQTDRLLHLEMARAKLASFTARVRQYSLLDEETTLLMRPVEDPRLIREVKIARVKAESKLLLDGEDVERELSVIQIRLSSIEATTELESIDGELDLLRHHKAPLEAKPIKPVSPPTVSKITQPFVLVKDRQQVARDVFRPGHSLPTMTVDEYLNLERQRGGIISSTPDGPVIEEDEDCDKVSDRQNEKDRKFDIFKDDNPRGWGNTHNLG
ncbi:hypothetical protein PSACC_02650 [Paramicrosporidium saccamoebae]|uniref:TAP42-like protein n=1 Tax=Paramicrosporidium saccamoebae TaxID=1246581 RepID=A0A2H9TIM4_9FUNG|nr:hypothetical protein PSACC_02650 [Paramicrosporidium saccamoebae]